MNVNIPTKTLGIAGAASLALVLGAAVYAGPDRKLEAGEATVDLTSAVATAVAAVPGQVLEVELERERGQLIWEVELAEDNGRVVELELDAVSGDVLVQEIEDEEAPTLANYVGLNDALAAVAATESGMLIEAELELDDGAPVWEIKALSAGDQRTKYRVDALSGSLL